MVLETLPMLSPLEQITNLQKAFPGIGDADPRLMQASMNGQFIIVVRQGYLGKTYGQAVNEAIKAMNKARKRPTINHLKGFPFESHFFRSAETEKKIKTQYSQQKSNLIVLPVPQNSSPQEDPSKEIELGVLETISCLIGNRFFLDTGDYEIVCAGDRFRWPGKCILASPYISLKKGFICLNALNPNDKTKERIASCI